MKFFIYICLSFSFILQISAQKQCIEVVWIIPDDSDSILVWYNFKSNYKEVDKIVGEFPLSYIKYLSSNLVQIDSLEKYLAIEGGDFSVIELQSKDELIDSLDNGSFIFKNRIPFEIEDSFDISAFL